jgi:hypothetical protein
MSDDPVQFAPGTHPVPNRPATLAESDPPPQPEPAPAPVPPALDPTGDRPETAPALDATGAWPAPDPAEFAEEDTDPSGFPPVSGERYPPATDPFDDPGFTSAYPLPGWTAPPGEPEPAPGARRSRKPLLLTAAAAVALAGLIAAILLLPRQNDRNDDADRGATAAAAPETTQPGGPAGNAAPAGNAPAGGGQVTGPADGRTEASFDLVDSATLVEVSAADLGDDLFRVSTAAGSGLTPAIEQDGGAVRLRLRSDGSGGSARVTIMLSSAVRWTLRMDGGAARSRLDLTGADLAALDLNGGASRIDLTLPEPRGPVPVRMTGGVDQFLVNLPDTTPVRVRVQSGAGRVTVGGATHQGIAPGRSFTANGWNPTDAGIDLLAVAGLSTLTVTG